VRGALVCFEWNIQKFESSFFENSAVTGTRASLAGITVEWGSGLT
jgi:hypothetical protein